MWRGGKTEFYRGVPHGENAPVEAFKEKKRPSSWLYSSDSLPVFILMINKSDFHYAAVDFVITRIITDGT